MKRYLPKSIKRILKNILYPIPPHLLKNHKIIDKNDMDILCKGIKNNYFTGWRSKENYSQKMYEKNLNEHLYERLEHDRRRIVPWLDAIKKLTNAYILEIGCGTGSSTVTLAEQGARVIGIDIDEGSLSVAEERCRLYGLNAEFKMLNATEVFKTFRNNHFDLIIFFASLEHMTISERLISLNDVWKMLKPGGLLVILETPNRLWYFDEHTSLLPFYHWLPDELAFKYSRYSFRDNFNELYREYNNNSKYHFLRRGRGVSFHELEIAIKPADQLLVKSSLSVFEGFRYKIQQSNNERNFKRFLRKISPKIHEGFFDPWLDLVIEKD